MKTADELVKNPNVWEITPGKNKLFSSDEVVDAYLKGKKEGLQQSKTLIFQTKVKYKYNWRTDKKRQLHLCLVRK